MNILRNAIDILGKQFSIFIKIHCRPTQKVHSEIIRQVRHREHAIECILFAFPCMYNQRLQIWFHSNPSIIQMNLENNWNTIICNNQSVEN